MEELVLFIAKNLVDDPEQIVIETKESERGTVIQLSVAPDDMGKVIGKQGKIARAIRKVLKAASLKQKKTYLLEIV